MRDHINRFWFNQKCSYEDMGLIITEPPVINIAERDISFVSVPGKDGDLIQDNGRYKNIMLPYKVAIFDDYNKLSQQINNLISCLSLKGYYRLQDTYDSKYFRMATVSGQMNITTILQKIGNTTINFNCKPFKYALSGEEKITLTEAGMIFNAEMFDSKPYIKIFGNGNISLSINNETFSFTEINEYIELDSEIMNAFKGIELCNNKMLSANFPTFSPGYNSISWIGDVNKIEIIPRWCTI